MAENFRIINIDVNKPAQSALVYSIANPNRINMGPVTAGDQLPVVLRFVNNGAYDDLNGDSTYTWRVGIANLGGTVYAQSNTWYPSASYGLTGSIQLSTAALTASLVGNESITSYFEVEGFNSVTGKRYTFLQVPITIYNDGITSSVSPLSASQYYTSVESDARFSLKGEIGGGWETGSGLTYTNLNVGINAATPTVDFDVRGTAYVTTLTASIFTASRATVTDLWNTRVTSSNAFFTAANNTRLTASSALITQASFTGLTASNASFTGYTASNALFPNGLTSSIQAALVTGTNGNFTRFTSSNSLLTDVTATRITASGDITFPGTTANALLKSMGSKVSSSVVYEDASNNVGIGTSSPSSLSDAKLVVWRDATNPGGTTSVGAESLYRTNSTGSATELIAHRALYQSITTAGIYTGKVIGLRAESTNAGVGTQFNEAVAIHARPRSTTSCIVTSSYGLLIDRVWTLGAVTDDYGVYIATPSAGTYTRKWGVYQQDPAARNHFIGMLSVGSSTGSAELFVTGDTELDNVGLGMTGSISTLLNITASTTAASQLRLNAGGTPSAPTNGDIWNDSVTGLTFRETSLSSHIPGVVQRQSTTVTRNGATGTAQTLLSPALAFPANFLKVGQVVRVKASGYQTVVGAAHTAQVKLSVSGAAEVVLVDFGSVSMGVNVTNDCWNTDCQFTVRSVGAGGTLVADGQLNFYTGSVRTNSTVGTATVNTTETQNLLLSVTLGSGDSSDKWECQQATVEVL